MTRQRRSLGLFLVLAALLALAASGLPAVTSAARASTPASSTLTVSPTPGPGTAVPASWTGTVLAGANATSECTLPTDEAVQDEHTVEVVVPDMGKDVSYSVKFEITWEDDNQDLILTVFKDNEVVGSSDGGEPKEAVVQQELGAGTYTAVVCPFLATAPVDYTGTVSSTTVAVESVSLEQPADDAGLEFSAEVPADLQRDEGEPLIEISPDGRSYTCGPTGFSQAAEYAQVSTDGGDQFHLLGEPPRGQFSLGGGGDCSLAISPEKNDAGEYQLSYTGLSGLLEFTTSTSPDAGKTFESNAFSQVGQAVDRQWTVATSTEKVFLNFNRVAPSRDLNVCESNDRGFTYPACRIVSPAPLFPGPMRAITGDLNTVNPGQPIVYYPWTQANTVKLAVSMDNGANWNNCTIATTEGEPGVQFAVADHDDAGNMYVVYGDDADFNIYMSTLTFDKLGNCQGGVTNENGEFKANPGFTTPVIVNREPIRTTVFPWVVASGEPGRVGVSFYGTQTEGRADTPDPKTWHVYVNQSLNALDANPDFSQVQATTHPNHYDQICLLGLGCTTGGDRSLVDFFAIDYNERNGEYVVVFNQAHKRPKDTAGTVSSPIVFRQIAGPSNGGGTVARNGRQVVRTSSVDPTGDALADYSSLYTPPQTTNLPAADITGVKVGPAVNPETGAPLEGGGFTVTMTIDDLSDEALQQAQLASGIRPAPAPSLLYLFRFVDGYRYAAVQANYDPIRGFTFGHSDYSASVSECGTPETNVTGDDQCLQYLGETPIQGAVDQEKGTITMTVPLNLLQALKGPQGANQVPAEVPAKAGDRIYAAAAWSQSNPVSPDDSVQSFLYPLDNAPAMDFLIPAAAQTGNPTDPVDPVDPGDGDDGVGDAGDGRGGDDGVGDAGDGRTLPATGGPALLSILGLLAIGAGGWTFLRRRP